MQYIEHILYWAGDNIVLSLVLGYLAACIESFIPALPIMAIAAINAAINGLVGGFLVSWLGSCTGAIIVFLLVKKLAHKEFLLKRRTQKVENIINKIERSQFMVIFLFYTLPVLPSSLMTIAAGFCDIKVKDFVPPLMFGKFLMMFLASYIGSDFVGFIQSPLKILVVTMIVVGSYLLANKMKKDMDKIYEKRYKEKKYKEKK